MEYLTSSKILIASVCWIKDYFGFRHAATKCTAALHGPWK